MKLKKFNENQNDLKVLFNKNGCKILTEKEVIAATGSLVAICLNLKQFGKNLLAYASSTRELKQ